jgi:DNA (cytosine-5)-methyltransferase 1
MKRALSLFSGGGGLDCGVEDAGFTNICSIEIDPYCVETLKKTASALRRFGTLM